jgi:hypothetical protein
MERSRFRQLLVGLGNSHSMHCNKHCLAGSYYRHYEGHDPADDSPIVRSFDTPHIRRQMRLNPLPLLIA